VGRAGRTYFIQHSEDLGEWLYLPEICPGADAVLGENFQSGAARFSVRLQHSDIPAGDPRRRELKKCGLARVDTPRVNRFDPIQL
jgi:hypothetical protein